VEKQAIKGDGMSQQNNTIDVYIETGEKKVFAVAADWPGWSRSGSDEASALQALADYGPRYAQIMKRAGLDFSPPAGVEAFRVVERLEGGSGTDFGVPGVAPPADTQPVSEDDLRRFELIMRACWEAFAGAIAAAQGRELRKGPRGGGRDLEKIARHVLDAGRAYLKQLGWTPGPGDAPDVQAEIDLLRQEEVEAMAAKVRGELPEQGPRGGARWPLRYYVRRAAWHVLDHVWEIEDRVQG